MKTEQWNKPTERANCGRNFALSLKLVAAATSVSCALAALTPVAAAQSPVPGTVRVFDQNNWRRECVRYPGTHELYCDIVYFGLAKLNASVSTVALGADINSFDENTTLVLAAGNPESIRDGYGYETYSFRLGDDPRYHRGKHSARIPIIPFGASRPWGWATLTWSSQRLNVRLTTQKFSDFFELSIRRENGRVSRDLEIDLWVEGLTPTATSRFQVAGLATTLPSDDEEESSPTKYKVTGAGSFSPGARPSSF